MKKSLLTLAVLSAFSAQINAEEIVNGGSQVIGGGYMKK